MDDERDRKRKKQKHRDDDEERGENRSKRQRSRSRSPARREERDSRRKRRHSRSKSPVATRSDKPRKDNPEVKNEAPERKNKETDMLNTRTGGAYIPPARLRMMQAQITDKASVAYQRLSWEALKKSIHGHINKINVGNIGIIIKELLRENIVRGRGLLCRSIIQAQAASPTFTNVYAALVAAVNSRFPNIGELLLKRLVIQFKRGFKRNDKPICISAASFIAHLVNQRVAHEILALELLTLLVETPTDDSVEVSIAFLKECGQKLTEVSSKGTNAIFEMLRNILHEGQLDKRVQYMIEVMFQVWKDGFKDHPALIEELELVPEEDQFTHLLMLDDATDAQDILNVFKFDDKYEENEQKYKDLSKEILGSDGESGEEGSGSGSGSEEEDDDEEDEAKPVTIIDNTETNLIALRRTIYLTINSSLDFEECAHKLMKMQLKPGQEVELCHMFLDCCAEQRTYEKFYGLLAQRFCNINRIYIGPFEEIFKESYGTAHRLDTNRLRNVSKFFAHLLITDSISWEVLDCVKLNEEDTTSSSRIYIKILFQELAEYLGLKKLNDRLQDPTLQGAFSGVFPRDNPKNTRFSINFFTSIGLGGLTDALREHLKQMPKNVLPAITEIKVDSESSSDSSSSSSDSSSSDSDEEEEEDNSKSKKSKSKSKESKDKSKKKDDSPKPKTPIGDNNVNILKEAKERWGHDGFYETYGKDAKRHEPRREVDDENFVKPFPRDRRNDRRRDDENGDDRRRDDRNGDDRRRDDRNGDDRRRDGRNVDDRRRNDQSREEDSRRDSRRNEDGEIRRKNIEESRDISREDRKKRSEDDGYDSRSKSDRESKRNDREARHERPDKRDDRKEKEGRVESLDDRKGRRNDKEERPERIDDSRRNERDDRYERPLKESRKHDREEIQDRSDERDGRRNDREARYDREEHKYKEERNERDDRRPKKHEDDGYESRSKKKDIDRSVEKRRKDSSEEEDAGSESDPQPKREKGRSKKDKRKEKKRKESSEHESDSDTDKKKKAKKAKKEKRREKRSETDESDSDSDNEKKKKKKSKKDKKKSRKEKENEEYSDDEQTSKTKTRKSKAVDDPEGWDIPRASSVKREVSGRYWDSKRAKHSEEREISLERSERKRQG